jgi:ABC-type Fe3+-hydroxamate transport system substrate-binding protein
VEEIMKRVFAILIMILSFIGLSSCNSEEKKALSDNEFPALVDTREETYKENEFKTLNGDTVKYNQNTRKIVCLFGSQDVVSFGIKLLAYEASTDIKGYEKYYDGAIQLVGNQPFNSEEILNLEPELILVNQKMSKGHLEVLKKIAPTIPLYTDSNDFSLRLNYIGKIFGLTNSANTLIEYEKNLKTSMLEEVKNLNLTDKTLTIYTYLGNLTIPPERGWYMNTILYEYLGFKRLDNVKNFMQDESVNAYPLISSEKIKEYEGDLVIYASFGEDKISSYVTENVGWQMLDAVIEDRVGMIDITYYSTKGVLLLYNQYSEILNALKKASNHA